MQNELLAYSHIGILQLGEQLCPPNMFLPPIGVTGTPIFNKTCPPNMFPPPI